ncbi:MAG: SLATT domain-containing protein [Burkholderiaceae bacterium]|nr:SLATT domain-containing protein [Burkholderiaceae bacterium]
MSDLITKLADEASRVEEDTEHSFKGHYNAAGRWGRYHLWIGLPAALLAAIAGATAFRDQPEWAGALALVSTALTTVLTFLKPSERAEMHNAYFGERDRSFRSIVTAHHEAT